MSLTRGLLLLETCGKQGYIKTKKKLYTILKVILDKRLSALNFQLFHVQEMAWMEGASIKVTRMEVALMEVASMDPA